MFFPAEMHRITIGIHRRYAGSFLHAVHEAGIVELTPITGDDHLKPLITPVRRDAIRQEIAAVQSRAERAVEILISQMQGERGRIAGFLLPIRPEPVVVPRRSPEEILHAAGIHEEMIGEILDLRTRRSAIDEHLIRLNEEEEQLTLFGCLSERLPPRSNHRFITLRAGLIPTDECEDLDALFEEEGITDAVVSSVCRCREEGMVVTIAVHNRSAEAVDDLLRSRAFADFTFVREEGRVEDALADITSARRDLHEESGAIEERLHQITGDHLRDIAAVAEDLALARERIDAAALAGSTRDLRLYTGWIRKRDIPHLKRIGDDHAGGTLIYRSVPGEDGDAEVPVSYEHPWWLAPFAFLTTTFARPKYREIDPTIFIAPVLIITFGVMLGDAGYGLLLAIIAAALLAGPASAPGSTRDLAIVLVACGISGTLFGILQGGFFGDLLPRFFGASVPFAVIDPLMDPLILLTGALIFGIIHLNIGLAIASYRHLSEGKPVEMLRSEGVWFLLQPCAAILLFAFFGWAEISQPVILAAGFGAAVAAALIFLVEGPLGFFSITGFLGDWLSYTRILALALATAGIAMTINILAEMIGSLHPVLVIVAVLFAIAGHAANLVLQALGGFIHALRLQYVEFFGTFYAGGGRVFLPFASSRTTTRLMEDDQ
ncbi:hypothetical protein RJ53_04115 [Methanocalculus chunghsingensis]|uniref:A-type ATP synthase subunit I n=1 Tax=Methanocalculus chunghsingensis TaxID=156457 RepID=A0A8J7W6R9_9EURY|nr:V-type ATPase 116kDa subunit family protein [Methanocalculus chunghsingensis]MBR1368736.1 hypothetical protein [Methanocalculus chunghsingensis]